MTDARTRILDAARELFLEEGQGGVTMRSVADRVGVTATALYRHFESKDALVHAVIDGGFQTFGGYLYRSLKGATAAERMRLSGQAYLDFALEQPEMYRTLFMTPWPDSAHGKSDAQWNATFTFLV